MIDVLILIPVFIISLFLGSFFNVLIDRIYRGEQFVTGSSYCESCKTTLVVKDLIPVFSYLSTKGRCRYCKTEIPVWLPIVEISTAVIFTLLFHFLIKYTGFVFDLTYDPRHAFLMLISVFIIAACGILIFFTDAKYFVIPTIYLYVALAAYIGYGLYTYLYNPENFQITYLPYSSHLWGMAIMAVFFGMLYFGTRGKMMGEGDIYLAAILGLMLGLDQSIVMWFFAFLIGAAYSVVLLYFRGATVKSAVPFGPFLLIGGAISYFWGIDFMNYYFSFL